MSSWFYYQLTLSILMVRFLQFVKTRSTVPRPLIKYFKFCHLKWYNSLISTVLMSAWKHSGVGKQFDAPHLNAALLPEMQRQHSDCSDHLDEKLQLEKTQFSNICLLSCLEQKVNMDIFRCGNWIFTIIGTLLYHIKGNEPYLGHQPDSF